jgi:hypothetical protein
MNLGRRILASTLLAVIVTAAAGAQSALASVRQKREPRFKPLTPSGPKARVAVDLKTIERMLAPDFYFQLPDRKFTRQEFIDRVHSLKITRFVETVLTVEPRDSDWSVFIFARVEVETKDQDGKTSKEYRALVSRDGWRKVNDHQWTLLSSEALSQQRWKDERPPIANW